MLPGCKRSFSSFGGALCVGDAKLGINRGRAQERRQQGGINSGLGRGWVVMAVRGSCRALSRGLARLAARLDGALDESRTARQHYP
jgi:hypothetical protein